MRQCKNKQEKKQANGLLSMRIEKFVFTSDNYLSLYTRFSPVYVLFMLLISICVTINDIWVASPIFLYFALHIP